MYLILVEALWPWFKLPGLGNVGFTLVLVSFALVHCWAVEGFRGMALFFVASAIVSYVMEEIGVRTGLIYGAYHYSDLLGTKLGHVPVIIPLAWFMMIYPSWMVAREILRVTNTHSIVGITAQAIVAAWVMTAWDVVMDPGMAAQGNWVWERGGAYFGVPPQNYFGWLLTTFLVYWIAGWLWKSRKDGKTKLFEALPVIVYSFFAVRYVATNRFPELQIIALFSMGMPALVATAQICLHRNSPEPMDPMLDSQTLDCQTLDSQKSVSKQNS
jgi:putative membrane protein